MRIVFRVVHERQTGRKPEMLPYIRTGRHPEGREVTIEEIRRTNECLRHEGGCWRDSRESIQGVRRAEGRKEGRKVLHRDAAGGCVESDGWIGWAGAGVFCLSNIKELVANFLPSPSLPLLVQDHTRLCSVYPRLHTRVYTQRVPARSSGVPGDGFRAPKNGERQTVLKRSRLSRKTFDADRATPARNLTSQRSNHRGSSLSFSLPTKEYLVKYRRKEEKRQENAVERKRGVRGSSCPKLTLEGTAKCATVKGNGGFGDYSAAGEFEVWGDEHHAADGGLDRQVARPPSRQQRCEGGSSLRPLLHVAHCELHSPREAELLRLDHLEGLDHKSVEHDAYSMMDNFHSPVPPPLPRRHVRLRFVYDDRYRTSERCTKDRANTDDDLRQMEREEDIFSVIPLGNIQVP
ncbi:hypothetical protein G5I_02533 [Acromyrmex echinatior]|uniref:Uncharacterized protein n=1 Tax=Acromyrmex echinatior TaxID=103372 RepID=F4WAJ5_ACREC|nr:hypothetical protein G5I_02533 [Acromyrmex echinatior]